MGFKQTLKHRQNIGRANKGKHLNTSQGKVVAKNGKKFCSQCDEWKFLDDFHKRLERPIGVRTLCKVCERIKRCKDPIAYRLTMYKSGAKSRGIDWRLTKEQFSTFWQKSCYYCGSEIQTIGLDRIDSERCYEINNVVPCCHTCNVMKLALSRENFLNHCRKVVGHLSL